MTKNVGAAEAKALFLVLMAWAGYGEEWLFHGAAALDYPSYISTLIMSAGKTIFVGAIIATEFAMVVECPDGYRAGGR